ncbi:DEAD/DEAH box helicase [Vreelandella alkaliphila]|uniref:Helicase-related protein n=1 Tax=Vreelandella alkaliphila TaxID=272774 RepID=A0AAJ2RXT6_9GAMM|nr:helicase-related protein [Halomonas alkaliphila]MDX5976223.1 helicase-related protein [Halomonas alkaliphila]
MAELIKVEYARNGKSATSNALGMREMQARAYEKRDSQYLLLKAPPASGKSRALMFLALYKLHHLGLRKAIVAVPEMSIGASFKNTDLTSHGFDADWHVDDRYDLCRAGSDSGKVDTFCRFLDDPNARTLVCTHATLRYAFAKLKSSDFDGCLVAIDEFHHVSVDEGNRLGGLIDDLMRGSDAHIVAMTGSYFRGDAAPILLPDDEAAFDKVTYTYYEQLNGYRYLKSLGIGYHFYQGGYLDAIREVLDPDKKTIVHIPNVNSMESTKDKYGEVDHILDALGEVEVQDSQTGIVTVRHPSGKVLKVADLVTDTPVRRDVQEYLRNVERPEDVDVIIALGMAKEGFDWPYCEHVLTIGYRNSMTEIVQIIGRATRDSEGKTHAQFTNLIAEPNADDKDVKVSVNNLLKAITVSLLMEQVLAPSVSFKPRSRMRPNEEVGPNTVIIDDTQKPVSDKVMGILESGGQEDIIAALLQKPEVAATAVKEDAEPEVINQVELPKIIERMHPDLDEGEQELLRETVLTTIGARSSGGLFSEEDLPDGAEIHEPNQVYKTDSDGQPVDPDQAPDGREFADNAGNDQVKGSRQFIKIGEKFVNIEHLNVDLINQINPFQGAYEILSKALTAPVLKVIQDTVVGNRTQMSEEEAVVLWPKIVAFTQEKGHPPSIHSDDHMEVRYAEALAYIQKKKRERMRGASA